MQVITRIGVVSFAKIMGMSGLLSGLVYSIPFGLIVMLMSLAAGAAGSEHQGAAGLAGLGVFGGLMSMILIPIIFGVVMFISGLIYGLIINLVLSMAGGLELEIRGKV